MNIFVLDTDPYAAARMMCDKHVVKMVLETGQILSTVHRAHGSDDDRLYRTTHQHHPCTVWAGASRLNYKWVVDHFTALALEYNHRYGRNHKTWSDLFSVVEHCPAGITHDDQTPFALAMPDEYKTDCPVQSYRNYYMGEKMNMLVYTNRAVPDWMPTAYATTC
jgi:hypothetical protein